MDAGAIGTLLGGIGLFLLGMSLMTDSLTSLGGDALRRVVQRLIHRKHSALLTGIGATALLQSSSATTLITVGFVSAGLVTFSESLGLILGANIGTTATSWIVSLVGLKLRISSVALPLVGFGALLRLLTRGRKARIGLALSGFGLIFVGIDVMQQGMATLEINLTWGNDLPGPLRTAVLVGIGMVMTVVMQSSSAAAATTLVALSAGRLDLHQAAALVIGQNVGTTITAIIGASGGSLSARRTAVAHVLFNVATAAVALLTLQPFLTLMAEIGRRWIDDSPETAIAMFHTGFNTVGVLLVYPWLGRFAALVERLVPRPAAAIVVDLPKSALSIPAVALETGRAAAAKATIEALRLALLALRGRSRDATEDKLLTRALELARDPKKLLERTDDPARDLAVRISGVKELLVELSQFLAKVETPQRDSGLKRSYVELLRAIDHARRLVKAAESSERRHRVEHEEELRELADPVIDALEPLATEEQELGARWLAEAAALVRKCAKDDRNRRERHRESVMERLARGDLDPMRADKLLAAARWIGKTPKHAARAFLHLASLPAGEDDDDADNGDEADNGDDAAPSGGAEEPA